MPFFACTSTGVVPWISNVALSPKDALPSTRMEPALPLAFGVAVVMVPSIAGGSVGARGPHPTTTTDMAAATATISATRTARLMTGCP
jgi:hypothetical protein